MEIPQFTHGPSLVRDIDAYMAQLGMFDVHDRVSYGWMQEHYNYAPFFVNAVHGQDTVVCGTSFIAYMQVLTAIAKQLMAPRGRLVLWRGHATSHETVTCWSEDRSVAEGFAFSRRRPLARLELSSDDQEVAIIFTGPMMGLYRGEYEVVLCAPHGPISDTPNFRYVAQAPESGSGAIVR